MIQGTIAIVFGTAIITAADAAASSKRESHLIGRWNSAIGIFEGIVTMITGTSTIYLGFASNLASITMASYSSYIF